MTHDTYLFVSFLALGALNGALWGACNHIIYWAKYKISKKILRVVFDITLPLVATFTIIVVANNYNLGQIRWFFVLGMAIGFAIERKTVGKLFVNLNAKLYNMYAKTKIWFFNTNLGKRLGK